MKTVTDLPDEIGSTETVNLVSSTADPRRDTEEAPSFSERTAYTMYELVRGYTGYGERPSYGARPGIL